MVGENEELLMRLKVDLLWFLFCWDNFVLYIDRVNYCIVNYKRVYQVIFWCFNFYELRQGWEKIEEGVLEFVWLCGFIFLFFFVDLLEKIVEEMEDVVDEEG